MTTTVQPRFDGSPINGDQGEIAPGSLPGALNRFYRAFNGRDLELMQSCWFDSPQSAMSNPVGGFVRGWSSIYKIYERILTGPVRVFVEFFDYSVCETEKLAVVYGRERGSARSGDAELTLAIRTSRVFVRMNDEWRQVHHHGSIPDSEMLAAYTALIQAQAKNRT